MKKILVSMFLLVFGLCLVACENIGNNKLLRNQAGYEWLDDINIENIEKVQIEFGDGMTYIGNRRSIYSSIETEVIKDVFDYWYNCKVEQYSQDNEGVMDAGSEHTKFYLKTGEVKEIAIIGIYLKDSNGMDFKVESPYRMDESKFLRTYKFVTDEEYGKLYEYTPIMEYAYIGDVPMKEIEFMEMMDEIDLEGVVSQYFIETNFGKIHFLLDVYFWVERTNVSSENEIPIYYQLYNTSIYDLAEKYMNSNSEGIYKLTIQNQTEYELIGIKNEYKADEEVEIKMIYEDDVCTFVFLNGELLGTLNGSNSLKFNMPDKDSTLVLTYTNAEIYKVNVIDNFDLLIVPLKEYYNAGDTVQVITKFLSGPRVDVQVDGQFLEIKELEAFGYYRYEFIMPEKDVEIVILYNGLMNKPCEDNTHKWDEGIEIDTGTGTPVVEYTCRLCGNKYRVTLKIPVQPSECPYVWKTTEESHTLIMLCDCHRTSAVEEPHKDLDKNHYCDECGYVFHTTGINGIYTPELLANLNHNINKIDSLIIEEEILYVILQNNESEKIGKFELISESSIKLNQIINIDDLSFTNEESKNIVNQLLDKDSFYSMEIVSIPEIAPTYILVELNNEFYYIYMESNIAGVSVVTIYHLNK